MIEIVLVILGMLAIGYSFYHNVRTLSEIRDANVSNNWKLAIRASASFVLVIFFVLGMVFFDFISLYALGQDFPKIMVGFAFLASSLIVVLIVLVNSASVRSIAQTSEGLKRMYEETSKAKEGLERKVSVMEKELRDAKSMGKGEAEKRIRELQQELEDMRKITRHAVGRELKMVELKKEIEALRRKVRNTT